MDMPTSRQLKLSSEPGQILTDESHRILDAWLSREFQEEIIKIDFSPLFNPTFECGGCKAAWLGGNGMRYETSWKREASYLDVPQSLDNDNIAWLMTRLSVEARELAHRVADSLNAAYPLLDSEIRKREDKFRTPIWTVYPGADGRLTAKPFTPDDCRVQIMTPVAVTTEITEQPVVNHHKAEQLAGYPVPPSLEMQWRFTCDIYYAFTPVYPLLCLFLPATPPVLKV